MLATKEQIIWPSGSELFCVRVHCLGLSQMHAELRSKSTKWGVGVSPLRGVLCIRSEVAGSQPPACSTAEHSFLPQASPHTSSGGTTHCWFLTKSEQDTGIKAPLPCSPRPRPASLFWEKHKQRITPAAKCICSHFLLLFSCWRSNSVPGCKPAWLSARLERGAFSSLPLHNSLQGPKFTFYTPPNYPMRIYPMQQGFWDSWWCKSFTDEHFPSPPLVGSLS